MAGPRKKMNATGGTRYVRRDAEGQFTADQVKVGRSLAADRRTKAKTMAKPGYGDQGDRPRRKGPKAVTKSRSQGSRTG